jgi:hypothetical protein
MSSKRGAKKARRTGKGRIKGLSLRALGPDQVNVVKGGKRADGTGGGNVAGGWDLVANKVHS